MRNRLATERRLASAGNGLLLGTAVLLFSHLAAAQPAARTDECPTPSIGLLDVAQRVAPDHLLETGAAGDLLVKEAIQAICAEPTVRDTLPNSCSPLPDNHLLVVLRNRLVLDAATQASAHEARAVTPEQRARLRVVSAVVNVVLSERSYTSFSRALATARAHVPVRDRFCGIAPLSELPPPEQVTEATEQVGLLLQRLQSLHEEALDTYRETATLTLRELHRLGPAEPLAPEQQAALANLVAQISVTRAADERLRSNPYDKAALRELIVGNLQSLALGLQLLRLPPLDVPDGVIVELSLSLAAGDLNGAFTLLGTIAEQNIPADAVQRVKWLLALLQAESSETRERMLRQGIFAFEPWPADYLVDAHLGALRVSGQTYKVAGDLLLGYNGTSWGVAMRGNLASYDLSNSTKIDMTDRYGGNLEAWLSTSPSRNLTLEARLALGALYYDTRVSDEQTLLYEESILGRGSALVGLRYQQPRFALGLWLGGGLQFDRYTPTLMSGDTSTMTDAGSDTLQGHATGRLRLQYQMFPDVLAVRLAADGDYYHLTRATVVTSLGGTIRVQDSTTSATHADTTMRLYLDAEVARCFDFVPGIAAGFDLTYENAQGNAKTAVAPVLSAGFRRTSF